MININLYRNLPHTQQQPTNIQGHKLHPPILIDCFTKALVMTYVMYGHDAIEGRAQD